MSLRLNADAKSRQKQLQRVGMSGEGVSEMTSEVIADISTPPLGSAGQKKTRKVRSACERCRFRRIKCDGHIPACGNCAKAGVPCIDLDSHNTERRVARGVSAANASVRILWLEDIIRTQLPYINLDAGPPFPHTNIDDNIPAEASSAPLYRSLPLSENLVTTSQGIGGVDTVSSVPTATSPQSLRGQKRRLSATNDVSSHEASVEEDTRSVALDLGLLSLNRETPQVHYLGSSSGSLFASLLQPKKLDRRDFNGPSKSSSAQESRDASEGNIQNITKIDEPHLDEIRRALDGLYEQLRQDLPPRKDCDMLLNRFFQHMHPNHPFLHRPSFEDIVDGLYQCAAAPGQCQIQHNGWPATVCPFSVNGEEHIFNDQQVMPITSHVAAFQLLVALSIGATLQIRQRKYAYNPMAFFKSAISLSNHVFSTISLPVLQAVLLLVTHSLIDPEGYNIWTLIHVAMAHAIDLGIHREVGGSGRFSIVAAEMRRRIFFCIYSLNSTIQGRPLAIADGSFDVQLPKAEMLQTGSHDGDACAASIADTATMPYTIQVFKMAQILSKIKTGFYLLPSQSDVMRTPHNTIEAQKKLHEELDQWLTESSILVEATAPPDQYKRLTTKLKIQYHGALCLLHQPSQVIARPGDQSLRYCFNSAAERLRLYETLYETGTLCHSWRTVQDLFLAGATVMYCVCISSDVRRSVSLSSLAKDFRSCSSMLSIGGEWWPIIRKARASLERLANHTLEIFAEKAQSESDGRRVMPQFRSEFTGTFRELSSDEPLESGYLEEALAADFNHEAQLAHIFDNMPMAGMIDGRLDFSWDGYDFDENLWIDDDQDQLTTGNRLSEDNNGDLINYV